jgi:hypothetical protein
MSTYEPTNPLHQIAIICIVDTLKIGRDNNNKDIIRVRCLLVLESVDTFKGSIDKISISDLDVRSLTEFRPEYLHEHYLYNPVPDELVTMLRFLFLSNKS